MVCLLYTYPDESIRRPVSASINVSLYVSLYNTTKSNNQRKKNLERTGKNRKKIEHMPVLLVATS